METVVINIADKKSALFVVQPLGYVLRFVEMEWLIMIHVMMVTITQEMAALLLAN